MHNIIDVAIIGAGPYGLSLGAHLANAGIPFRIFGQTMESWKTKMPPGMLLKSYPWASNIYDPSSNLTLKQFYTDLGIPYHDSTISVPLQTFISYGEAFQARLVPNVEHKMLVSLERSQNSFLAKFDDGDTVMARQVVIGVGVHPFKFIPSNLRGLPAELLSHSGEYGPLESFSGKEVAVLGSGASATDLAALLYKQGSKVSLIARTLELPFMPIPQDKKLLFPMLRQLASPLKPIKRFLSPNSCIASTWLLKVCANYPKIFHSLPQEVRLKIVKNELGPSGHWAIKDIVKENVDLHLGSILDSVEPCKHKTDLKLISCDGSKKNIQADHLISATGYKIDLHQLSFLDKLLPDIYVIDNAPVLSVDYESSIPGLYFMGPASANCFGPVTRFVCGAIHPAQRITRHIQDKFNKAPNTVCGERIETKVSNSTPKTIKSVPNILQLSVMFRTPYRVLRCAHEAGANVFVLGTKGAKGLQTSRFCKDFFLTDRPVNGSCDRGLAEEINSLIKTHHIDWVLAGDTPSTCSLISIRDLLNAPCFPMPQLEPFDRLNNKWEFYLLSKSLGIECPNSRCFKTSQDLAREITLNNITFPSIIKPLNMEAQWGVIKLVPEDANKQIEKISYAPIMLQDFIEGEDIGASVFCRHGKITAFIAHTFRRYTYVSFFDQGIYDDINKIASHLKLDGIFNFDMRRTPEGRIFYLECNPRVFWKISMSMLAGMNFISIGISDPVDEDLIRPAIPKSVRFPKATLWYAALAPWKLDRSSWDVLKYLYRDPIPYFREMANLENDAGGSYL
jgi:thioredoxin reductase